MASASEAEVLIVVDNIKEFVKNNANLIKTQKQTPLHVQNLCSGLEKLGDLIKRKRYQNVKLERLVISCIRDLVHEAEEAIETWVAAAIKRKNTRKWFVPGFNKAEKGEEIIEEVDLRLQKVGEKVDQLFQNFDQLVRLRLSKKKDQIWNEKALFPGDDKHIVGDENQVNEVIDLLKGDSVGNKNNNNLEVISITGVVGSGKTTLARRVFEHSTLESLFSLRAFVCVNQEDNNKKINIFQEILRQFGEEEDFSGLEDELEEKLGDCLNNSSFLIVLDDVCSLEELDDIRSLLAQQQQGNQENQRRVLLMVRKRRMGIYDHNLYELPPLDLKGSRELLRMEIFGEKDMKCPMELEMLETKILEKCYGLPLAVISFARILARRRKKIEWWKKAAEHVNVFTEAESLMNKAIRSIFDGLNDNLKLCFLYLGAFQKNFEIKVWDLLRLWMAEGLVGEEENSNNNKSIEDVAEDYLEELVDRNLVTVKSRRSNGKVKSIKIHYGLLDFCLSEAKEENIFRESFFSDSCRRLCIRNSLIPQFHNSNPKSTTPTNFLRSILHFSDGLMISSSDNTIPKPMFKVIFRKNRTEPPQLPAGKLLTLFLSSVPKTFKLLRVLDIRSFELTEVPAELFSFFLLRYVGVSCKSSLLPKELSNLCNLQTLIIQTFSNLENLELKADVRDMPLLRHIHSNKSIIMKKLKIGNGSVINQNLQTISRISPVSCKKELFEKIPNLEKLGVSGKLSMKGENGSNNNKHNFFDHIAELNRLRNLKLLNYDLDDPSSKYVLPQINSGSFPASLTNLTLGNTYLTGENMSVIGKMENLEILKLKGIKFEEDSWESKDGGFGKLRVLHVKITDLKQWKASENHFPRLASLFLWHCRNLKILPVGLPDMRCLETVDLNYGHDDLASSLKTILLPKLENQPGFKLKIYPPYKIKADSQKHTHT